MKKTAAIALSLALVISLPTSAFAANGNGSVIGNGKGLVTAPGQASNFSKGITTEVYTSTVVNTGVDTKVTVDQNQVSEAKSATSTSSESTSTAVTESRVVGQGNGQHYQYRDVTTTVTVNTTTVEQWNEVTTTTTTTTTKTPYTETLTTTTTVLHHGAPNSNGSIISSTPVITRAVEYGTPEVSTVIDTAVAIENYTSATTVSAPITTVTATEWHDGNNVNVVKK